MRLSHVSLDFWNDHYSQGNKAVHVHLSPRRSVSAPEMRTDGMPIFKPKFAARHKELQGAGRLPQHMP